MIGQTDFVTSTSGVTDSKFNGPMGINVDYLGNLYVADFNNNRVLVFNSPATTEHVADYVFGQGGSFTSSTAHLGGVSESSLNAPSDVDFDTQ